MEALADWIMGWLDGYLFLHHNSVDKGIGGMALKNSSNYRGQGSWTMKPFRINHKTFNDLS